MDLFDKIMKDIEMHRKTHIKVMLPGRGALVKHHYQMFLLEYDDSESLLKESGEEITISLSLGDYIVTCADGGNSLINLIALANCTEFNVVDGKLNIELWYRLWEWEKK